MAAQYGARDDWNLRQQAMELERWKEQQANARAAADRNAQFGLQKYLMDRQEASASAQRELERQMKERQQKAAYRKYANEWAANPSRGNHLMSYKQWIGG